MARPDDEYHGSTGLRLCHVVVLIFYSLSALFLSIVGFHRIRNSSADASDVALNWQTGAIMDIAVGDTCPPGYEGAFNYTWPGTHHGCDCAAVSFQQKVKFKVDCDGICQGRCSANATQAGCTTIQGKPAVPLDAWGVENGHQVSICVKRSKHTWAEMAPRSGEVCKDDNYIRCGQSPNTYFCTNETRCPINDIQIVDATKVANLAGCAYDSGCLILSKDALSTKVIKFQRGDTHDGLPTVQLRVNEYGMCKTVEEDNITPNRREFPLLKAKRNTCGNEGAGLWATADTITEAKYFDLNGLTDNITYLNEYGYYEQGKSGKDYHWSLFTRSYLPWAPQCRDSMKKVTDKAEGSKGLWLAQLVMVIASAIAAVVLGVICPLLICLDVKPTGRNLVNWIGKLIHLPFIVIAVLITFFIARTFRHFVVNDCSNPYVLEVLHDGGLDAEAAYHDNLKALGAILLAILFDLVRVIFCRGNKNEAYQPQVNVEVPRAVQRRPTGEIRVDVKSNTNASVKR